MRFLLAARMALLFLVVGLFPARMLGQDVSQVIVERSESFRQCTTNRADLLLDRAHGLVAMVFPAFEGAVLSAELAGPRGLSAVLSNSDGAYGTTVRSSASAPAGTYTLHLDTYDKGAQTIKVALPGPANGLLPLRVANFTDTQLIDATQDFTLVWDKVPKLNSRDYLRLAVADTNGTTVFYVPQMDIAETQAVIPAGTLQPNTAYRAWLCVRHLSKQETMRPPYVFASEYKETCVVMHTLNPAGVFRFAPEPVLAREQEGVATVTVERTQGSTEAATVDYFCTDGSAHSNVNYVAVSGTLDFPPGVTNQSISVPLLNDGAATLPLDFQLTLTNAQGGAGLVVRPHRTVTTLDADHAPGTNVHAYLLGKVRFYAQTSTNLPCQSNLCVAARFFAVIHSPFAGAVTNAWLQLPKGGLVAMPYDESSSGYMVDFPSAGAMNKAFAGGTCKFAFDTLTDGAFAPRLALGAERLFAPPHLSNWADLQAADPAGPITLEWDAFRGATGSDCVRVSIRDAAQEYVLQTPDELEAGALPGSTRSYTIPAGKLDYGQTYLVDLIFSKVKGGKQVYPGLRNGMVSVHTTSFYLHTIAAPGAGAAAATKRAEVACPCERW